MQHLTGTTVIDRHSRRRRIGGPARRRFWPVTFDACVWILVIAVKNSIPWQAAELIMVNRGESAMHAVQLSMDHRALLDSPNAVLADIRAKSRIRQTLRDRRPHAIFHAAALKHLPLLEQYPGEEVKTKVWGP